MLFYIIFEPATGSLIETSWHVYYNFTSNANKNRTFFIKPQYNFVVIGTMDPGTCYHPIKQTYYKKQVQYQRPLALH